MARRGNTYDLRVTAQQAKQFVKNALYRTIGETSTALRLGHDDGPRLSILMYHKVNDLPDNPTTVPIAVFDEQLERLAELGYNVVDLEAVLDHYTVGTPLPEKAVLITFDDGYRDVLDNALPVLQRHGYPAVIFIPVAYMEDDTPLPHETHLVERGMRNPTLDWDLMRELDASGVVLDDLQARQRVAVPSAWLKSRRACVPATVSLSEIRSQAPDSTRSNVRSGYGSTLYRPRRNGFVSTPFAREIDVNAIS